MGRAWGRATGQLRRAAGRLLVTGMAVRDLLLCAKHLFVAAKVTVGPRCRCRTRGLRRRAAGTPPRAFNASHPADLRRLASSRRNLLAKHRIQSAKRTIKTIIRRSLQRPAVAFSLGIARLHLSHLFGKDALQIAAVTATAIVYRLRTVAEADDCPAANRTDLYRRHPAPSVVCARAGSTASR